MVAVGDFTMARAVREWYFVQVPLVALRDFQSAARARGLDTLGFLDPAPWETLDRRGPVDAGGLRPARLLVS